MFKHPIEVVRSIWKRSKTVKTGHNVKAGKFGVPDASWRPTHRHRKGGDYRVIGQAILEADRSDVVVYDDRDGNVWVRSQTEFHDGRFIPIEPSDIPFSSQAKTLNPAKSDANFNGQKPQRLNFTDVSDLSQLNQLSTPLWIFDVDRHCLWWANPQGLAFWKAGTVEELRMRDFSTDSATVRDRLRQIVELASDDNYITDTWTLYPSGEPQTTVLTFQPVEIESELKGILIEVVQVLERDADDDTWRLLEAARATSLMMTTFSMDGRILTQNPAALACYGAVLLSEPATSDLAARFEDQEIASQVLLKAAANETSHWEAQVVTANGIRTHSLSVRKGRDPVNGDFVTVLSEEDVTEYVRLREMQESEKRMLASEVAKSSDQLRVSQERYALAVQTAAILDWDAMEDKIFLSPNLAITLGYRHDEFADNTLGEFFPRIIHPEESDESYDKFQDHLSRPGDTLSMEFRLVARNHEGIWFNLQGNCVRNEYGKVTRFVGLLTDISDRKKLEKKLMGSQRMEAIGQLTGGIAHDFNNLLTVIQGNAELLEASGDDHQELTSEIVNAARRGADLTRHLLAFARQQTLIPKTIDLNDLVPKTIKSLLRTISETVTVEFICPDDVWTVYADRTQLETAILNLALNARDAMTSGGTITIRCQNVTGAQIGVSEEIELTQPYYVAISVSDTGKGMPEDEARKAFEPFFTTKGVGQGSGLGLSMVLGFSRQSGGDARILSTPGRGTTVTIYLPQSDDTEISESDEPQYDVVIGNKEHIHILEDNQHVQQIVSKLVRSLGYEVTLSNTAAEAQDRLESGSTADLYLIDILLPGGVDGVTFARGLRDMHPDATILFMSGFTDNHLIDNIGLENSSGFIAKPFDRGTISRMLRTALDAPKR